MSWQPYIPLSQCHLGLCSAPNRGWTGKRYRFCVTLECFEWRLQASMAHDHCCVNFCSNDKGNKSDENLFFFNFLLHHLLRLAVTRQDEGPDFKVSRSCIVTSELLDACIISDWHSLSIKESASNFLWLLNQIELTKNWFSSTCWSAKFFTLAICFVGALYPT